MIEKIKVWFRNNKTAHHRLMMKYLQKRGWVVFYLEEEFRECSAGRCWMNLYNDAMKK